MTRSVPSVRPLCEGAGCLSRRQNGRGRRRASTAGRLCRSCRDELGVGLERLPALYGECERLLSGARRNSRIRERTSEGPVASMPFNTTAADVRARILAVLGSWSGMVVEQRGVAAPRRTVLALATFLGEHADWLAAHSAAAEATAEVAQLVRAARRVAYPDSVRRVRVGACVAADCEGELVALMSPGDPSSPLEITCDADPEHRWPAHRWAQLSHRLRSSSGGTEPATRWLSAAEVSRLWKLPTGSVYRLASEDGWRRRSRAGRTYYCHADVELTFGRRESRADAR